MAEENEWKVVNSKKKKKTTKNIIVDNETSVLNVSLNSNEIKDNGSGIHLPSKFIFWCHDIHSKDWSINGYSKLCSLENISDFWKLFNNLNKLGYKINNFFLMKDDTDPTWEHINNRDGGICSLRIEITEAINTYEDLCTRLMCNILTNNYSDINGISISPKNNWAIIKIWNKSTNNDLSKTLTIDILEKYKNGSIKYKANEPEY